MQGFLSPFLVARSLKTDSWFHRSIPGNGFPAADLAIGFLNFAQKPGFCPETGPGTMLGFWPCEELQNAVVRSKIGWCFVDFRTNFTLFADIWSLDGRLKISYGVSLFFKRTGAPFYRTGAVFMERWPFVIERGPFLSSGGLFFRQRGPLFMERGPFL